MGQGRDSLVSLKNDISDLIEKSFGSQEKCLDRTMEDVFDGPIFIPSLCASNPFYSYSHLQVDLASSGSFEEGSTDTSMVERFENFSVQSGGSSGGRTSPQPSCPEVLFTQASPVTRSQLRRGSAGSSFQFARPAEVEQQVDSF